MEGGVKTINQHNTASGQGRSHRWVFAVMLVLLWLAGQSYLTWSYFHSNRQYQAFGQEQIEQRTELIALMQSELLATRLQAVDQTLLSLRQVIPARENSVQALTAILQAQAAPMPHITELLYLDLQGDVIAWTEPQAQTPNVFDRSYFRAHLEGSDKVYVSLPMVARVDANTPFMAVSRPVFGPNGDLRGVLAAALDLEHLAGSLSEVTDNDYLRSVVVHNNGEIVLTTPHSPVEPGQRLAFLEQFGGELPVNGKALLDPAPDGPPRQVAYSSLGAWNLAVVVGEDLTPLRAELAAVERSLQQRYGMLSLAGTLLVLAIGWLMYRRLQALTRLEAGEKALAASHQRNKAIVSALPDLLVTISSSGKVLDYEAGDENTLTLPGRQLLGRHIARVLPRSLARKVIEYVRHTLSTERLHTFEHRLVIDGEERHFEVRCAPLDDEAVLLIVLDITARKSAQRSLQWQATHDSLTHLPNRVLFYDRLKQAIASAQRYNQPVGLLYLDLDGFKAVNDSLGHHAGDQLLQEVARRLRESVRDSDTVARLAGDEFAVIAHQCNRDTAHQLADKLAAVLAQQYDLGPHQVCLSASVGTALCPQDGADTDSLVRAADKAMYRIKHARHGRTEEFTP